MHQTLLDQLTAQSDALDTLGLKVPTSDEIREHLRQAHWGELPFLRGYQGFGDDLMFSLRIDPARPQRDWPVICSVEGQPGGLTYASSLRTFTVNLLARQNTLEGFHDLPEESLAALHHALSGGEDQETFEQGLTYNLKVILPEAEGRLIDGETLDDLRIGQHLALLDQAPLHVRFRNALSALLEGRLDRRDLSSFGPWASWLALAEYYAFAQAQFQAPSELEAQGPRRDLALNVLAHVPQYDAGMLLSYRPKHFLTLPPTSFKSVVEALVTPFGFETLIPEAHPYWQDPIAHLILSAHAQAAGRYDGLAHIAAAAMYDEDREDPVRSFEALQTGTFWAAVNAGIVLRPALDAAISLARRRGWDIVGQELRWNASWLD
ncbi:hypothetical protein K7W42_16700 [Deinococcus sp. HMF7604]|uniref:hypothetical protein n=1 Tax=Deinococcus betulae TaxID=2873312 RepID=UPI001CC9EA6F|nr:hypothetical protein [Deinococcus betulae]MBZ9752489.1 hypothetical protein [Deinococcus betulae]